MDDEEQELINGKQNKKVIAPKKIKEASTTKNKPKKRKPDSPTESEIYEKEEKSENEIEDVPEVETDSSEQGKGRKTLTKKGKATVSKKKKTKEKKPKMPTESELSENETDEAAIAKKNPKGSKTLTKKGKATVSKMKPKEKKPTNSELSENETEEEAVADKKPKGEEKSPAKIKSPTTKTKRKKRKAKSQTPVTTESENEVVPNNDGKNENVIEQHNGESEDEAPATEPTVKNVVDFKASADFNLLIRAKKNEEGVIHLLTKRTNLQRRLIARYFMMEHGRDFVAELRNKLGKSLDDVIIGLMIPPVEYLCRELLKAIKAQDNQTLIEILCTRNNCQVVEIAFTYEIMFRRKLICKLESETKDHFNKFISLIISGNRKNSKKTNKKVTTNGIEKNGTETELNAVESAGKKAAASTTEPTEKTPEEIAKEQANELFKAGKEQNGINHEVFSKILAFESFKQINLIMEEYRKVAGRSLEEAIEAEVTGSLQDAYMAVVECAVNRPAYFAKLLNKALNMNDPRLKRIIINRSEIDLGTIKKEYERIYGENLFSVIKEEGTAAYKKLLLPLIGDS